MPRKKTGEPPATITFRLEPALRKKLRRRADEQSTSEQHVVTEAVTAHLSSDSLMQRVTRLEDKIADLRMNYRQFADRLAAFELAVDGSAPQPAAPLGDSHA